MLVDILEIKVIAPFTLYLRFDDGMTCDIDLSEVIKFEGIFAPLKNEAYFATVRLDPEVGTICWDNGADLSTRLSI